MDHTTRVSSSELVKDVERYHDIALMHPVVITSIGREPAVMISAEEYDRLKRRDRRVFAAGQLPDALLEAVERSEMDERHSHLDDLIQDWTP